VNINFEINNDGKHFTVLLFDSYVVKFAKSNAMKDKDLERMANLQTEISKHVDGVLPCKKVDNVLVMPRAIGVRTDNYRGKMRGYVKKLMERKQREIENLGYKISDVSWKNCIYNDEEDKIYFIDFHRVERG